MVLGTHELKGKVEKLKQPFCILEKKSTSGSDDGTGAESYEVTGVVKQKLLFNQYPKIIMR